MIRLGLCCLFLEEPIRFRRTTAASLKCFSRREQFVRLSEICLFNARSLFKAIEYCGCNAIGAFRVNSQLLPLKTHPQAGYDVRALPEHQDIRDVFLQCKQKALELDVRLSFHPDQFVLLSSPDKEVTRKSIEELDYQAEISEWIGADVINIHGGGAYGDKAAALKRVAFALKKLNKRVRARLTFENDDRVYTPADLLPLCEENGMPLVYDVHHHRCLPDGISIEETMRRVLKTWNREPLFHVSSPREGWKGGMPRAHHDFIDPGDFPECWRGLNITVEVEAKAKELAVRKLSRDIEKFSRLPDGMKLPR